MARRARQLKARRSGRRARGGGWFSSIVKGFTAPFKAAVQLVSGDAGQALDTLTGAFTDEDRAKRAQYVQEQDAYWRSAIPTINKDLAAHRGEVEAAVADLTEEIDNVMQQVKNLESDPDAKEERRELLKEREALWKQRQKIMMTPIQIGQYYFENPYEQPGFYREGGPEGKQNFIPMYIDGSELPRIVGDRRIEAYGEQQARRDFEWMKNWNK